MKIVKKVKKSTPIDELVAASEQQWLHADSRVIVRQRDVLQYELQAIEEHANALRASLAEVTARRRRVEARVQGMTRALARR